MSATFSKCLQNRKKMLLPKVVKSSETCPKASGRYQDKENPSEESYLLTYLLSQSVRTKYVLLHVVVKYFLQVFRSSSYAYNIGKK